MFGLSLISNRSMESGKCYNIFYQTQRKWIKVDTMQVYLVTAMTHVIALEAGQSSQGALKPITPVQLITNILIYFQKDTLPFYHLTCNCHRACIVHHYLEIGISRPIYPPPLSKQCTTVRGLLSVNILLAMLITVTL